MVLLNSDERILNWNMKYRVSDYNHMPRHSKEKVVIFIFFPFDFLIFAFFCQVAIGFIFLQLLTCAIRA